jgi:hypothetical protein
MRGSERPRQSPECKQIFGDIPDGFFQLRDKNPHKILGILGLEVPLKGFE